MKLFFLLLAVASGVAYAARPGAVEVIDTFKEVAPLYAGSVDENEALVQDLQHRVTDEIVVFHSYIIELKETFVQEVIEEEDKLSGLIGQQDTTVADALCMSFIEQAADENVNLVGVAFTTCVNSADDAMSALTAAYYGRIGNLEGALTEFRLLDVFRGDNVFFTPEKIVSRLRNKLTELGGSLAPLATDLEEDLRTLGADLFRIRDDYKLCLSMAEGGFRQYVTLARTQLTAICSGSLAAGGATTVAV